ncbi:unnamed protein product [Urochloa humidicola]
MHADSHQLELQNNELRSEVERLRGIVNEQASEGRTHGEQLTHAEEECDAHRTFAEQKAQKIERLGGLLQEKDEALSKAESQLHEERAALAEARSQLQEKEVTLTTLQTQVLDEHAAPETTRSSLQRREAELATVETRVQEEEATARKLTETLAERVLAIEGLHVLAEGRGASMSALLEEVDVTQVLLTEEKERTEELQKALADTSAQVEVLQTAYSESQKDLEALDSAAVAIRKELEGGMTQSGNSLASRLRSLGGCVAERLKGAFRFGIQKTLGVISTHFIVQLDALTSGYVVAEDLGNNAALAVVEQADAAVEGPAAVLSAMFEDELFPDADGDDDATPAGHHDDGSRAPEEREQSGP